MHERASARERGEAFGLMCTVKVSSDRPVAAQPRGTHDATTQQLAYDLVADPSWRYGVLCGVAPGRVTVRVTEVQNVLSIHRRCVFGKSYGLKRPPIHAKVKDVEAIVMPGDVMVLTWLNAAFEIDLCINDTLVVNERLADQTRVRADNT
jgi:hypothetical protein